MQSANGARGFFVSLLTGDSALSKNLPDELLTAFKNNAEIVYDLLAKNAVMSSSTAYQHLQSGDEENARKSISVAKKSLAIINKLNCNEMRSTMEQMARAIDNKIDAPAVDENLHYAPFLARWRYSKEQLDYARTLINQG
jgi:4-diphosphocytidyl-2C-methyl-D-erythritol kinase